MNIQTISLDVWRPFIDEAAARFGMPQSWIEAVMRRESGGRTNLDGMPITSPVGAMGLMQLMPKTYAEMRERLNLGADPYDPHDNILAGVGYLRAMYNRYGYPYLFAAYNAGPLRLDDYLLNGIPLPNETKVYLGAIVPGADLTAGTTPREASHHKSSRSNPPAIPRDSGLFFAHSDTKNAGRNSQTDGRLFVFYAPTDQ